MIVYYYIPEFAALKRIQWTRIQINQGDILQIANTEYLVSAVDYEGFFTMHVWLEPLMEAA